MLTVVRLSDDPAMKRRLVFGEPTDMRPAGRHREAISPLAGSSPISSSAIAPALSSSSARHPLSTASCPPSPASPRA